MLLNSDFHKKVNKYSDCLSLCSFNKTCAAMYFDVITSTCHFSGNPTFLNVSGVEPKAFVKGSHISNVSVMQCDPSCGMG